MNLSEFFFYKVFKCHLKEPHEHCSCYYNHDYFDTRRPQIDMRSYIMRYNNEDSTKNMLYGYNTQQNKLNYYCEHLSFGYEKVDQEIFVKYPPCNNKIEFLYHINKYNTNTCSYIIMNLNCPLGKLCYNRHKDKCLWENEKINNFANFIRGLITKENSFVSLQNVISMYEEILQMKNKYLTESQLSELRNEATIWVNFKYSNFSLLPAPQPLSLKTKKIFIKDEKFLFDKSKDEIIFTSPTMVKKEELIKYAFAMLNSHNGKIIIGVDINTGCVKGILLSRRERDLFKCWMNGELDNLLIEFSENIKFDFYDVKDTSDSGLCIFIASFSQIKKPKIIENKKGQFFVIKNIFLEKNKKQISSDDIKTLNVKEYIQLTQKKLLDYYTRKAQENK